jgi:hypothetical protein
MWVVQDPVPRLTLDRLNDTLDKTINLACTDRIVLSRVDCMSTSSSSQPNKQWRKGAGRLEHRSRFSRRADQWSRLWDMAANLRRFCMLAPHFKTAHAILPSLKRLSGAAICPF